VPQISAILKQVRDTRVPAPVVPLLIAARSKRKRRRGEKIDDELRIVCTLVDHFSEMESGWQGVEKSAGVSALFDERSGKGEGFPCIGSGFAFAGASNASLRTLGRRCNVGKSMPMPEETKMVSSWRKARGGCGALFVIAAYSDVSRPSGWDLRSDAVAMRAAAQAQGVSSRCGATWGGDPRRQQGAQRGVLEEYGEPGGGGEEGIRGQDRESFEARIERF